MKTSNGPGTEPNGAETATFRLLRRFIDHRYTGAVIILLIILSVGLTICELSLPPDHPYHRELDRWNHAITLLFILELVIRFAVMRQRRWFLREYWLDVLAVLPAFRVFRLFRAARLLRLLRFLRLFRVGRLIHRHTASIPYIFRRGAVEYSLLLCFLVFTVIAGAGAMLLFEGPAHGGPESFTESFWWSVYTLLAGESITQFPATLGGRIVAAAVMFLGLGVFAMVTGTFSAVMVERLTRLEELPMEFDDLEQHIIICGYSRKVARIIDEIRVADGEHRQIVIIAEVEHADELKRLREEGEWVHHLTGDFTRPDVLDAARVDRCDTCIIVSDRSHDRSEQDADARTILAALTIEKLNPRVFTCAELANSDYIAHLQSGGVDDVVIGGEHSAMLLAQAAVNRGLGDVVSELLTSTRGNQFYKLEVPPALIGSTFLEALVSLKREHGAILLGYVDPDGQQVLNPVDHLFEAGERVILVAHERVRL